MHQNSKTVTIYRAGSFLSRAQGKEIDDFFATSKRAVGSYWESTNAKRVASGLTFMEEELLMPKILDVHEKDREFRQKVTQFFVELETQIPYESGRTLEIGLEKSNQEPLSDKNLPLNIMDYIRYRHALGHPYVAKSKEEAEGNSLIQFYIFDKSEVIRKNSKKADQKDAALQIYLEIKKEAEKVDMMLTLLGIDPRQFTGPDAMDLKLDTLRKYSDTKADQFISVYNEGDLKTRYWIKTMVNTGVLKVIGTKYLDAETNKLIGNSLEETIFFFNDEENSDKIVELKARTQEAIKRPVKARTVKA